MVIQTDEPRPTILICNQISNRGTSHVLPAQKVRENEHYFRVTFCSRKEGLEGFFSYLFTRTVRKTWSGGGMSNDVGILFSSELR